jgi:hypothetical protein
VLPPQAVRARQAAAAMRVGLRVRFMGGACHRAG